jgi:cytochrome c oxidase subunit IV
MSTTYEQGLKDTKRGLAILGGVTILEVGIALLGNGHLVEGFHLPKLIMYPAMIGLSLYKAYFIVFYFMHMRYEVKGLALSVLLPVCLLIWAIIAFLQEGGSWGARRHDVQERSNVTPVSAGQQGLLEKQDIYESHLR